MMPKIGSTKYGQNLNDIYSEIFEKFKTSYLDFALHQFLLVYSESNIIKKDIYCIDVILKNTNNLKKIAIVGSNLPITYIVKINEKYPNIEFTIIDSGYVLSKIENYLKTKFNIFLFKLNPLFNDISKYIEDADLVIYPETEMLVPFNLLKYKHKDKLLFCSNIFLYDYKINNNLAYCEQDLVDICEIKNVKIKGSSSLDFNKSKRNFYYVMGNGS